MNMRLLSALSGAFLLSSLALTGCAADTSSTDDGGEAEASEDAITGDPSNAGYFVVTRRDLRKCVSPLCGGFFVKRVNQAKTRCADGSDQAECYVSEITYNGIGLSAREEDSLRAAVEGGSALIKAKVYKKKFGGATIGTLKASEGWLGATGSKADGTFYRAANNGIVCVKAPCPTTSAYTLNSSDSHNVIDVRLGQTATPASQDALDQAAAALGTKEGILVAGGLLLPKCLPTATSCGPLVVASEFYLKVTPREGKGCGGHRVGPSFCNANQFCQYKPADICGAADASGTCQYKPEICYKIFKPVCGCDGKTYGNDCEAYASGTSVSSQGTCVK